MWQWVLTDGKKLLWNTAIDVLVDATGPLKLEPRFKGDYYWVKKFRQYH